MNDKISIAMTTHNGEKYLREQLDSLYSQTLLPDEIIVVDDCSKDNTKQILEEYHQEYGLTYFINESKLGVNKNFEKAITLCMGDYIALCDQDDVWLPHKIETSFKRIKLIEKGKPALVSAMNIDVDENLNIISKPKLGIDSDDYATTLLGYQFQGCTLMMNKALVNYIIPFPEDQKIMFDVYIGLTAAMIGNKYHLSEALLYYRHHNSNVCGIIHKKEKFLDRISKKFSQSYPGLVSNDRFYNMKIVDTYQKSNFVDERKQLFDNILALSEKTTIFSKLKSILYLEELSRKRKFSVLIFTIVAHFFNKYLRHV